MKRKTFVVDTNVLLYDPFALEKFPRSILIVPLIVLEELDAKKRLPDELGKNARAAIRFFDSLRLKGSGDFHCGVELENGATIYIHLGESPDERAGFPLNPMLNKLLLTAFVYRKRGDQVVLVSKDFALRVKAEAMEIEAEDYENFKVSYSGMSAGVRTLDVPKQTIDQFLVGGGVEVEGEFFPNEYCVLRSKEDSEAVARFDGRLKKLVPLVPTGNLWGINPRNIEQRCAIDLLVRDEVNLVALVGPAGTGKTLLALACALSKVFDDGLYKKILVSRPIVALGKDIGYLPGTKEEKLFHWMQPIYDNLEVLCGSTGDDECETQRYILESKKLEMEAVTYIRGRSLPKAFIIIDEAQNLTPHQVKTIVSRAGAGTKVILAGDPDQIDHPYLDEDSNGLTYTVGRFRNQNLFGGMRLNVTERSELAAVAAEIM